NKYRFYLRSIPLVFPRCSFHLLGVPLTFCRVFCLVCNRFDELAFLDIAEKAFGEQIKWQKGKVCFSIASRGIELLAGLHLKYPLVLGISCFTDADQSPQSIA